MTFAAVETFFFFGAMLAFVVAWGAGLVLVVRTIPIKWATPFSGESLAQVNESFANFLKELKTSSAGLVLKRAFTLFALLIGLSIATGVLRTILDSPVQNSPPTPTPAASDP